MRCYWAFVLILAVFVISSTVQRAPGVEPEAETGSDVLAGHSFHGEAFNEGPRQAAYLMPGLSNVDFPVSSDSDQVRRFINQGVAQLHGFWYYEAERSFRQAALLDPQCAISYWGMAMANVENRKRARDFIAQAVKRKETASKRERYYIEAYEKFCRDEDDKGKKIERKTRAQTYTRDLEEIVLEFPDDVEARAFLALQLWQNERSDLPIASHVAVDSVLQDVFDANPNHPAHHYRIHLWDKRKPERALASAAQCGPSLPAIAHMWHMPGHIYSKLHRYQDAVWHQEASARVDHAHMMRDRVMPDQIHNFAHNNEWLIRNLLKIGRVEDALSLAKNMLELPRHPKTNTLTKGSTKFGRERLLLTLATYRLWPELIELSHTMYLEPTEDEKLQLERMRYLGMAYALNGQSQEAESVLNDLQGQLTTLANSEEVLAQEIEQEKEVDAQSQDDDAQKSRANRKRRAKQQSEKLKTLQEKHKQLDKAIATLKTAQAAAKEDWQAALEFWEQSELSDKLLKGEWLAASGKVEQALDVVDEEIDRNPGEVLSTAVKTWLQYTHHGANDAKAGFEMTRALACSADLDTPLLARLLPLAVELGDDEEWAAAYEPAADIAVRPDLDSLGPFRWHPYMAPDFAVKDTTGATVRLGDVSGRPTIVIFYLGFGCLHCVEQLHEFSPRAEQFRQSGIEIIAISSEDVTSLNSALKAYAKPLDIPLHADPELAAFKDYRCFDDFEQKPLHGTLLLDPSGRVLWQDISYEPFMDVDFTLKESHRLLELAGFGSSLHAPKPHELTAGSGG